MARKHPWLSSFGVNSNLPEKIEERTGRQRSLRFTTIHLFGFAQGLSLPNGNHGSPFSNDSRSRLSLCHSLETVDPEPTIALGQRSCSDQIAGKAFRLFRGGECGELFARKHFALMGDGLDPRCSANVSAGESHLSNHWIEVHIDRPGMDSDSVV